MKKILIPALILITVLISITCSKKSPASSSPTPTPAVSQYTGITQADSTGNIISVDPDDWKPAGVICNPNCTPTACATPPCPAACLSSLAYPNPISAGQVIHIRFTLSATANVNIDIYKNPATDVFSTSYNNSLAGAYDVLISTQGFQPGWIYRCYITAGTDQTYGDIQIQ